MDVLASGTTADTVTDDELLAVLADRSRVSFADLQASPTAIVADTAAFGWVEERLLPEGRWRIAPEPLVAQLAELREPAPLVLLPRRQLRHLNSQLRDPVAAGGRADTPEILVHPADAAEAGIVDGDRVAVVSADGRLVGDARVDDTIRRGAVSVPHGFAEPNVGRLTSGVHDVDPLTGMVLQSGIPVRLSPATGDI